MNEGWRMPRASPNVSGTILRELHTRVIKFRVISCDLNIKKRLNLHDSEPHPEANNREGYEC